MKSNCLKVPILKLKIIDLITKEIHTLTLPLILVTAIVLVVSVSESHWLKFPE